MEKVIALTLRLHLQSISGLVSTLSDKFSWHIQVVLISGSIFIGTVSLVLSTLLQTFKAFASGDTLVYFGLFPNPPKKKGKKGGKKKGKLHPTALYSIPRLYVQAVLVLCKAWATVPCLFSQGVLSSAVDILL